MEMNGLFIVANVRGGGEYGQAWREAGTKLKKQNSIDDLIAATEWLMENRYTCPEKLAIRGSSNGGLLVGACMMQRPDLFGACLPSRGVMDMLRYDQFAAGREWVSEYGSPGIAEEFEALRAYSPYHNISRGVSYPATFVTTPERDDRIVPAHSYKFIARLQEAHSGETPVLIRIGPRAGNRACDQIEEAADRMTFLIRALNI